MRPEKETRSPLTIRYICACFASGDTARRARPREFASSCESWDAPVNFTKQNSSHSRWRGQTWFTHRAGSASLRPVCDRPKEREGGGEALRPRLQLRNLSACARECTRFIIDREHDAGCEMVSVASEPPVRQKRRGTHRQH